MGYKIIDIRNSDRSEKVLRSTNLPRFRTEAAEWFTDTVAGWLMLPGWYTADGRVKYHYASYVPIEGGKFIDERSRNYDVIDELPAWWRGEGIYDLADNLVMRYADPRDGSDIDIESIDLGDHTLELRADPASIVAPDILEAVRIVFGKQRSDDALQYVDALALLISCGLANSRDPWLDAEAKRFIAMGIISEDGDLLADDAWILNLIGKEFEPDQGEDDD